MRDIGVAFPLTLDQELEMPQSGRGSTTFKAFLLSIQSVSFGAQRGETGQAVMKNFSFQFVSRYVLSRKLPLYVTQIRLGSNNPLPPTFLATVTKLATAFCTLR